MKANFFSSGSIIVFLTAKTAPATVAAVPITPVATPLANECFFSHETILRICYNMLILSKKISRIASENIMKTKLIVVAGPTAVGKQRLELNWPSVLMAKLFQEIASRFTDN